MSSPGTETRLDIATAFAARRCEIEEQIDRLWKHSSQYCSCDRLRQHVAQSMLWSDHERLCAYRVASLHYAAQMLELERAEVRS